MRSHEVPSRLPLACQAGNTATVPVVKRMLVSAAGSHAMFEFDTTGLRPGNMGWQEMTWQFVATQDTTTLELRSLDGSPLEASQPDASGEPAPTSREVVLLGAPSAGDPSSTSRRTPTGPATAGRLKIAAAGCARVVQREPPPSARSHSGWRTYSRAQTFGRSWKRSI